VSLRRRFAPSRRRRLIFGDGMSNQIPTGGHSEVLALLERYIVEVKNNPKIGYAALALVEDDQKTASGAVCGDIFLEHRAELATRSLADHIRERGINRIMPPRDPSAPANYVCYNVPSGSICYDFLVWLIDAEMQRIRENAPFPLRVHFWFGRNGTDGLYLDDQKQMFECVVKPSLALIGAVEDKDAEQGRYHPHQHLKAITQAVRDWGQPPPKFRAPPLAHDAMKPFAGAVTITLREAKSWLHRNSNVEAWTKFARELQADGERVIFVRDTAKAHEPLDGFETCPIASTDLHARCALYEQAKANLFVSNGPSTITIFGDRPFLCFVQIEPSDSIYYANTPQFWKTHVGTEVGEQFAWSRPDQRIVWQPDTYENIRAAWDDLALDNVVSFRKSARQP
jgi:hypothetical protein